MWPINRKAGYQFSWQVVHSQGKQDTCQNIEFKFVFIVFWKYHLVNLRQLLRWPFVSPFCLWITQGCLLGLKSLPYILPAYVSLTPFCPVTGCQWHPSNVWELKRQVYGWLELTCALRKSNLMGFFPFKNYTISFISFIFSLILWWRT